MTRLKLRHVSISVFCIFCIFCIFLSSCDDTVIGQFDSVVIENQDNQNKLEQITFVVSLKDSNYGYLNLSQIDSLELFVNTKFWGVFTSEQIDTTGRTDRIVNNLKYSDDKINYLFVAPYIVSTENLETAGDFVKYLNDRIALSPGDYLCELRKVHYRNEQNIVLTNTVNLFEPIKVQLNMASYYIGEIEISIK